MDSFNKKISELYNVEQTSENLPDGFGWDDLSDGIYEKIEESKKERKFFWMWFAIGSTAFLLAGLFFYFNNETKEKQVSTTDISTEITKTKRKITPKFTDNISSEYKEQTSTQIVSQNGLSNNQSLDEKTKKSHTDTPSITSTKVSITDAKDLLVKNAKLNNPIFITKPKKVEPIKQSELTQGSKINPAINYASSKQPITISKKHIFLPNPKLELSTKNRIAPPINFTKTNINIDQVNNKNNTDEPNNPKDKIRLAKKILPHLYGGTLLTNGKYKGNQQRNQHSNWLPGYFAGLEFTVLEYKKWRLNLGYEHKFSVQLFDFQNQVDTISNVTVEDVVTGISTYSLDGTTIENREDILTQAIRTRNYLNYNTFRSHAVKLTVIRSFNLANNWQLITGLGGSYNFLNLTKGRTIGIDSDTLNYDRNNQIYLNQNWGVEGGFSLAYQLGKFSLRGNLWVEKALSYSNEPNTKIRPVFYKIGLGVSRGF